MNPQLIKYIITSCVLLVSIRSYGQTSNIVKETLPSDTVSERYVFIDNIFVLGNKRTKKHIIERELDIKKGMTVYYPDLVEQMKLDENKIFNTRLFNSVKVSALDLDQNKVDVVVQVDERWYIFPVPILRFADRSINDWLKNQDGDLSRLNYGMKFYQYNFRGRNERLKITAQLGFTKKLELSYRIPYIDRSQKNGLNINVGYSERKNIAYATERHKQIFYKSRDNNQLENTYANISYSRRSKFYTTHHGSIGFDYYIISDSIKLLRPDFFRKGDIIQKNFSMSYGYTKDKRDIAAYPLNGYRIEAHISKIGLGIFNDIDITTFSLSYDRYIHLGKNYYASLYSRGLLSSHNNQSYQSIPSLGSSIRLVRGYELYLIEGNRYLLHKMSIKKLLFSRVIPFKFLKISQFNKLPIAIYLKTYFDTAYVNNFKNYSENSLLTDRLIYGTGMGIDFVTWYDFVFRFEYSINHLKEHGLFLHFKQGF